MGVVTLVQDRDFRAAKEAGAFFFWKESRGCGKVQLVRQKGVCFAGFAHFLHTLAL
jgi:hypothetical protein